MGRLVGRFDLERLRLVSLLAYFGRRRLTSVWYILLEFPRPPFLSPMNTLKQSNHTIIMNHYPLLVLFLFQLFWTLSSLPLVAGASPALVNVSSVDIGRALVFVPSPERLVPGKPPPWPYMNPATRNPMNAIHLVLDTSLGNVLPSANISSISSLLSNSSQVSVSLSSIAQTIPIPTPDLYIFSIYITAMSLFIYLIYYNISTRKALRSTTSRLQTLTQSHASLQASARRHTYWTRILFSLSTKQTAVNKTLQAEKTGYLERISALLVDKEALSGQIAVLEVKMSEQSRRALDTSTALIRQMAKLDGQSMDAAAREEAVQERIQDLEQAARGDRAGKRKAELERDDLRARFEALEPALGLEQEKNQRLEAENVQLKTTVDKGNSTIQELTSTITGLTQSKDTVEQQCTSLKAQLVSARSDVVSLACSLSKAVKASSADRTTIADQRKEIRSLKTRVSDLEDFTLQCMLNIEHAKDQALSFAEHEESLKRELAAKDTLLADRSREVEEVRSQLRDSIASRAALEDHLASKTRILSDRESELRDAWKKASELELKHDAVHGEVTHSALLLAECHSKLDRALSDNSQLKISEARITYLHVEVTSKLERAEVQIQDLASQSAAKDTTISDQQEQLERARWEITDLQAAAGLLDAQVTAANVLIDERRAQVDDLEGRTTELEDRLSDSMFHLEEAKDRICALAHSEAELRCKAAALEVRLARCGDEPRDASARGDLEKPLVVKENEHKAAIGELTSTIEALQEQKKALESKANDQSDLLEETMMELMQCGEEVKACREREEALQGKFEEQEELLEETMMRLLQRDEEAEERSGREAALDAKVGELEGLLRTQKEARSKLKKETEAKIVAAKCKEFELKATKKKCDELKMQVALQRTAIAMGEEESKEQAKELKKLRVELAMIKMQRDAGILELEEAEEQEVEGMLSMTEEGDSMEVVDGEGDSMEAVDGEGDSMEQEDVQFSAPPVEPPQVFTPPRATPFSPKRPSPLNPLLLTPPPTPLASDEYPQMRDISILRAGVLVRQALRSCNAPVPKGDPEYDLVKPAVEELPIAHLLVQRTDENSSWTPASMPATVPRQWGSSSSLASASDI